MAASAGILFLVAVRPGVVLKDPDLRAGSGIMAEAEDQDVLRMTLVSHETGLQIQWFFNRDFEWEDNR
jgi:hypothetical protein